MDELTGLSELRRSGKMQWSENDQAWAAQPRDVVEALAHEGFAEYKLAVTRSRRRVAGIESADGRRGVGDLGSASARRRVDRLHRHRRRAHRRRHSPRATLTARLTRHS